MFHSFRQTMCLKDTVFLVFLTVFVPILYLPTSSESNARDFHLMTGVPGNVLATSERCRKCPQMFWRRLSNSKASLRTTIYNCNFNYNFSVLWFRSNTEKDTESSFNAFLDWIFVSLSRVKDQFVRIWLSGVRNCPLCVRLTHKAYTIFWRHKFSLA